MLYLAKVGEQLPRKLHELLEAIPDRGIFQQRHVAGQHPRDLGVNIIPPLIQLGATNTRCRKLATSGALSERNSRHAG